MYEDNLTHEEIEALREIMTDLPEPYDASLLKLWLTEELNYDTVSVYFEGQNPYDLPSESVYEVFWDSIEEWTNKNLPAKMAAYEEAYDEQFSQ